MSTTLELLSRREIAARMKRSPTAVNDALKRMKAKPEFTSGTFEYFHETIIEKLEKVMRRKNYKQRFDEQ